MLCATCVVVGFVLRRTNKIRELHRKYVCGDNVARASTFSVSFSVVDDGLAGYAATLNPERPPRGRILYFCRTHCSHAYVFVVNVSVVANENINKIVIVFLFQLESSTLHRYFTI